MICSIIIPSKWRFDRLKKSIAAFYETAEPVNFEIIVRLEEDDPESISRQLELHEFGNNLSVHVRPTKPYDMDNGFLWNDMIPIAKGTWHQYWSDDQIIFGKGWDDQLKEVPTHGFIVHPEIHQLNESIYRHDCGGPTPFFPANAIKKYGYDIIPWPLDSHIYQVFVVKHHWKCHFLKGIRVWHQRKSDRTLPIA